MTHEREPNGEAADGPEADHTLPDANEVRVYDDPEASDGPPFLDEDGYDGYTAVPLWAGPTRNEV